MAMEYKYVLEDAHMRSITCVAYNPFRKEIYTGSEDTQIKVWEGDSKKLVSTLSEHRGWITNLFFCKELKILFSSSTDGCIIAWGSNHKMLQKLETRTPVYTLTYNSRRQQLLAGFHSKVRVFQVIKDDDGLRKATNTGPAANNAYVPTHNNILDKKSVSSSEHSDVVKCIVSCESRFYSGGYDKKLVIYDSPHHGDMKLRVMSVIHNAHDAAISCMVYGKDADNSWLITGGFDRVVKLWSLDGNCLQKFDGFVDTISSVCYVLPTQSLWIASTSLAPIIYDPRSGINVSDFVNTDIDLISHNSKNKSTVRFKALLYVPETNEVIGTTSRKSLVTWKFNPYAPLTTLNAHEDVVETLTMTQQEPLLIFSGGGDGHIRKWERLQLNQFMYSQEILPLPKEDKQLDLEDARKNGVAQTADQRRRHQLELRRKISERLRGWRRYITDRDENGNGDGTSRATSGDEEDGMSFLSDRKLKAKNMKQEAEKKQMATALKLCYYEPLDLLVTGYEDSKIMVWGYNEDAFKNVPSSASGQDEEGANPVPDMTNDGVSNRVAGLTCKFTLSDHRDAVTGLSAFQINNKHYLLSSGWDRRIVLWDLEAMISIDVFRNKDNPHLGKEEIAADDIVLDLDYSPERREFAYASADHCAYIRKFSEIGSEMKLQAVLQGHEADVHQIRWSARHHQWITGSEDRTIRIWPAEGIPCLRVINNDGPVMCLCVDENNGCIVTGSLDTVIRVFDPAKKDELVQKNIGHKDAVRSLVHIPRRNQYASASWDQTIRFWNAYMKKGQRRNVTKAMEGISNAFYQADAEDEAEPSFSDLNPLIMPKLLTKGVTVREFYQDKKSTEEEQEPAKQSTLIENELRATLNELELSLNMSEKQAGKKGRNRLNPWNKPNKTNAGNTIK